MAPADRYEPEVLKYWSRVRGQAKIQFTTTTTVNNTIYFQMPNLSQQLAQSHLFREIR